MIELNTPKEANGYVYTILELDTEAIFECPRKCYGLDSDYSCSVQDEILKGEKRSKSFMAIKLTINVKNLSDNDNWVVGAEDVVLVDDEGFSYEGVVVCEKLRPARMAKDRTKILPHTQVNYIQLFPCMPENVKIHSARVNINHKWVDFILTDNETTPRLLEEQIPEAVMKVSQDVAPTIQSSSQNGCDSYCDYNRHWELEKFKERISKLRILIYSRLHNVLTSSEKTKLENKITNENYAISLELNERNDDEFKSLLPELNLVFEDYQKVLKEQNELEITRKSLSQKIEELIELSPREFEEYVAELLKHSGYENVELTPYSNDKGLDVIAYKDGVKFGIQCKRYKGTVGSPEIQTFLGALSHAKADKGLFITTGMFSFEAEKMASEHPIVLINRIDLAKMVFNALS